MSYEIIIKEKREVVELVGKQWAKIGDEEVERDRQFYSRDADVPKTRIRDIMGYTPEVEKKVIKEIEILKQTVDVLDLPSVIKAINNL